MAATRFQIYLEPNQYQQLRKISRSSDKPIAALIRQAVTDYLDKKQQPLEDDPIWSIVGLIDSTEPYGSANETSPDLHV